MTPEATPVPSVNGTAAAHDAVQPVIRVHGLVKDYSRGDSVVHALRSVTLSVKPGEFVAVMGPSGSGKSTFMNLIGCLDRPTSGTYELDAVEVTNLSPTQLADLRNQIRWRTRLWMNAPVTSNIDFFVGLNQETNQIIRTHTPWRMDEGRVECEAIRHFRKSVSMLGVTDRAHVDELYSYAWAFDEREAMLFPGYRWRACKIPKPALTW